MNEYYDQFEHSYFDGYANEHMLFDCFPSQFMVCKWCNRYYDQDYCTFCYLPPSLSYYGYQGWDYEQNDFGNFQDAYALVELDVKSEKSIYEHALEWAAKNDLPHLSIPCQEKENPMDYAKRVQSHMKIIASHFQAKLRVKVEKNEDEMEAIETLQSYNEQDDKVQESVAELSFKDAFWEAWNEAFVEEESPKKQNSFGVCIIIEDLGKGSALSENPQDEPYILTIEDTWMVDFVECVSYYQWPREPTRRRKQKMKPRALPHVRLHP